MGTGEWAQAQCSGPVKVSMLFRWYNQGAAITEAGVNASNHSDHQVRHYAQTLAGAAFANPSLNQSALVTIVVLDATGTVLNTSTVTLPPEGHQTYNIYTWVNQNLSGSVQIRLHGADCQPVVERGSVHSSGNLWFLRCRGETWTARRCCRPGH